MLASSSSLSGLGELGRSHNRSTMMRRPMSLSSLSPTSSPSKQAFSSSPMGLAGRSTTLWPLSPRSLSRSSTLSPPPIRRAGQPPYRKKPDDAAPELSKLTKAFRSQWRRRDHRHRILPGPVLIPESEYERPLSSSALARQSSSLPYLPGTPNTVNEPTSPDGGGAPRRRQVAFSPAADDSLPPLAKASRKETRPTSSMRRDDRGASSVVRLPGVEDKGSYGEQSTTGPGLVIRHTFKSRATTPSEDDSRAPSRENQTRLIGTAVLMQESAHTYRDRAMHIFKSMAYANSLGRDLCETMIYRIGHREPRRIWVNEIVSDIAGLRWHLDQEDACDLAERYRLRFLKEVEDAVGTSDPKSSCAMQAGDQLISNVKMKALPGVIEQIKRRLGLAAGRRVAEDARAQTITVEDLMKIRDTIIDCSGFTPKEHRRVRATFVRYDKDKDGKLGAKDVRLALTWLGSDISYAREVTEAQGDELVDEEEFIKIVKRFFHHEEDQVRSAFEKKGENKELIDRAEMPALFDTLGLVALTEALDECFQLCNLHDVDSVDFQEMYQVFMMFRELSGFSSKELNEISEAFQELDWDGSGNMDAAELEVGIHWLGYPSSFSRVRDVMEEYDIDESGEVELDEFAGFVARFRDTHVKSAHSVFEQFAANSESKGPGLPFDSLRDALLQLSFMPNKNNMTTWSAKYKDKPLSVQDFFSVVAVCRQEVCVRMRQNECFSDMEVRNLRNKFYNHVSGDDNEIANAALSRLIEELYPDVRNSVDVHVKARKLLEAADENGDGRLNFQEFLRMMRLFQHEVRLKELAKEKEAIEETKFSKQDAQEFRKVFEMFDMDGSGELSLGEFGRILEQLLPAGLPRLTAEELFESMQNVNDDGARTLTFPDFLRIVREMVDSEVLVKKQSTRRPTEDVDPASI